MEGREKRCGDDLRGRCGKEGKREGIGMKLNAGYGDEYNKIFSIVSWIHRHTKD